MPRIVSVWLERWPITRFLTAQRREAAGEPVDPALPLILSADAAGGPRLAAVNEAAAALGLNPGDRLADARARAGLLQVRAANPAADAAALERLAVWATRYAPAAAPWGPPDGADGFFIDIAGAAHLCGGEEALLADLARRLRNFVLSPRLAIARTPGAAWALARFGGRRTILPDGAETVALRGLPVEALRLSPQTCATLRRLGVKTVGPLLDEPRAPFAKRLGAGLVTRLDQALGQAPEPLVPVVPAPAYGLVRTFLDPLATQGAVVAVATRLMAELGPALERDGVGARILRLTLYRVDGAVTPLAFGLARPTRAPSHVGRLVDLRLDRLNLDAGFGFEAVRLDVTQAEPMAERQDAFAASNAPPRDPAPLADALRQRLGPKSVLRLRPVASHIPERAAVRILDGDDPPWPRPDEDAPLRPLLLLKQAEPAEEVLALVPDGPPQRFRWRRHLHRVAHAQGPERIAPEWWCGRSPTRDYYVVEDEAGRRLWVYREGLYGREPDAPRWFVHGLFP